MPHPWNKLPEDVRKANKRANGLAWYYRNRDSAAAYAAKYHREHAEERSAKSKLYEEKNRERRRAQKKIYRAATKERARAYYLAKREKFLADCAARYTANAEKIRKRVREYAAQNKDKVRILSSTKRARKRNATGIVSRDIAAKLMVLQRGKCAVCREHLSKYHLDHIEPLALGGAHDDKNLQLLCPPCNMTKHTRPPIEFMQSRGFLL